MDSLKLIIVDDNETFRKGISFFVVTMLKHKLIAELGDGEQFLSLPNVVEADIVLMDIEMPNINGIEAIKKYLWMNRELKAIAITNYEETAYLTELIGAGFRGCVLKKNIYNELDNAIKDVIQGKVYFSEDIKVM